MIQPYNKAKGTFRNASIDKFPTARVKMRDRLCEERLEGPMEDALSSASLPFRRNEFLTYILETRVPRVHFNVDDDVGLTNATTSPQCCDHTIPEYLQTLEGRGSEKPAMKSPPDGLNGGESSTNEEENFGEPGAAVGKGLSHSHCLEFLRRSAPNFLMRNLDDKERICSVLLVMADNVKVLPPGNEPLPWDVLNVTLWKASLLELMKEMKTVEEKCCASVIGNSGVYVLTTSPFSAFLRALAMEITDRCC